MATDDAAPSFQTYPGAPCWLQIPAYDLARATAFYQAVLGFTIRPGDSAIEPHPMNHFSFPGTPFSSALGGGIMERSPEEIQAGPPPPSGTEKGIIYFYVDDLEGALAKVEKAGGQRLSRGGEGTGGQHVDFRDTEGNVHGLFSMGGSS